ncbi:PAS domain-containing sensor histidine kinase [Cystobacter fuscus]|uniref:histidine kinase n=1 Tax=Cystobacter fuscus TaxID=43 RepID=A0A250JKN3_9BACT|nr:PAS domain-containing sensor histidine kinase [Cystobacter fuscus]ATB44042.1 PAS domain-containing sensor histidine kinase [Cystobacter fuscus]
MERLLTVLSQGYLAMNSLTEALGAWLVHPPRPRARARSEPEHSPPREESPPSRVGGEWASVLELLVEQSGDAIIMADAQGVLRIFNAEARRLHGVSHLAVAERDWTTFGLLTLDGRPLPLEGMPLYRALRGEHVRNARWRVRRPDGTLRILNGTAIPLYHPDGSSAGAVLIARDETERLEMEHRCAESLERLRRTAEFRERFLGIVGHDLRNPLGAIDLSARVLDRSDHLDENEHRMVGRIRASTERMARMIGELLDFTRSRLGGGMPVHPQVGDLTAICREALDEVRMSLPGARVCLRVLGHGTGEWDAGRLNQVISNLVSNAVHYSPQGRPVRVTLRGESVEDVVLTVHNLGPPIPPELLPVLFDPFRRGPGTGPSNRDGLGLGLYIVRQIVLAHGGQLDVSSSAGKGTTFTVRLPRIQPHLPPPPLG